MHDPKKCASIRSPLILFAFAVSLGLTSGCSSHVPPTVTQKPNAPIVRSEGIFVNARHNRTRIMESLTKAGLTLAKKSTDGGYVLDVRQGSSRSSGECGNIRNISYVVSGDSRKIMVMKGRGWTGECAENIFDSMSAELATHASK